MTKLISNPAGAYGETGIENNGRVIHERLCSTAILAGDVAVFDVMTGTDEIVSVHAATGGDATGNVAGVATEDASAGEVCRIVELGPAVMTTASGANVTATTWRSTLSADGVPAAGQTIVYVRGA